MRVGVMSGGCSLDRRTEPEMVREMYDGSKKLCADCGTSKTPLWRGGPAGPKSLCNACGIRSRKKRRALLESSKPYEKKMKRVDSNESDYNSSSSSSDGHSDSSRRDRLMAMWDVLKPQNVVRIEELNEEQEAAVLLMALSLGFSYC